MAYIYKVPSENGVKIDASVTEQKVVLDWKKSLLQLDLQGAGQVYAKFFVDTLRT